MSVPTKIAKNTFFNFIITIIKIITSLSISILVARLLGPSDFGIYGLLMFGITSILLLGGMGFDTSITKYISEYSGRQDRKTSKQLVSFALRTRIIATILVFLILLTIAFFYGYYYANDDYKLYLIIVAINAIPLGISGIFNATIIGLQHYKYIAIVAAILSPINVVLTAIVLLLGYGITGLLFLGVVMSIMETLISYLLFRRLMTVTISYNKTKLDPKTKKRFIKYSKYVLAISFLDMVVWQKSEIFFLGLFRTASEVGFYTVAYGLSTYIVAKIPTIFSGVLMPAMSELHGKEQKDKLSRLFIDSTRYLMMMAAPLCVIGILLADPIVEILYGYEYLPAATVLRILLISATFGVISGGASGVAYGVERPDFIAKFGVFLAILNIILNLLLIPSYGIIGAAIGNMTAQVLGAIGGQIFAGRLIGVKKYPIVGLLKITLSAIVMGFVIHLAGIIFIKLLILNSVIKLLILPLVGLIFYLLFTIKIGVINENDLELLTKIEMQIPQKALKFYRLSVEIIYRIMRL